MIGKRCSLCGGKIKNHICEECGLDDRKCDEDYKNYHINESSCDGEPLTHVHMDEYDTDSRYDIPVEVEQQKTNTETYGGSVTGSYTSGKNTVKNKTYGKKRKSGKAPKSLVIRIIRFIVIMVIIANVIPSVFSMVGEKVMEQFGNQFGKQEEKASSEFTYNAPSYASVSYELKEEGDSYEDDLLPGYYQVGAQIPEGLYQIAYKEGEGDIQIYDVKNGISSYVSFHEDVNGQVMKDVRLYEGAYVKIGHGLKLSLSSDNAQVDQQTLMPNPNTEEVVLTRDAVAGEDFPAGVYDISLQRTEEEKESGEGYYGSVGFLVKDHISEDNNGDPYPTWSAYLTNASWNEETVDLDATVHSVVLPEGAKVAFEETGMKELHLTPSQWIKDTNYEQFYDSNQF